MTAQQPEKKIESRLAVQSYLQDLRYAIDHGAKINFQEDRQVDHNRPIRYTNRYTVSDLFPNENPIEALRRELKALTIEHYIGTVRDTRYPKRSPMWEFGKTYHASDDVYIKIRVELLAMDGNHTTFVMSFHYAQFPFTPEIFPYRNA